MEDDHDKKGGRQGENAVGSGYEPLTLSIRQPYLYLLYTTMSSPVQLYVYDLRYVH